MNCFRLLEPDGGCPRKWQFGGELTVLNGSCPRKGLFGGELTVLNGSCPRKGRFGGEAKGGLRSALEQFLFADCGYEFLEVERLEVGYVLEIT